MPARRAIRIARYRRSDELLEDAQRPRLSRQRRDVAEAVLVSTVKLKYRKS
jgi:hypothetical protein